jgi:hypothetical protein
MISAVYVPGEGVVADEGGPDPHRRDTGLLHSAIASDLRRKIYGQQPAERTLARTARPGRHRREVPGRGSASKISGQDRFGSLNAIDPSHILQRRRRSHDRAARRHLNRGNAPAVQQYGPITVSGAKHTGVLCQRRDDVLNNLVGVNGVGFLVRDVHVIATGQPYPQHNLCHGQHPMVAWLSTDVAATALGPPASAPCTAGPSRGRSRGMSRGLNPTSTWPFLGRTRRGIERRSACRFVA